MIMAGANIQSSADMLRKVQEDYLYHSLLHPKPEMAARLRQLRVAYRIDSKQYAVQKRSLPYVVCGIFNPPYRRTENFAYIENFIVDIDHLASKELSMADVRKRVQADSRVLLCFASPSEDGLKVMFRLSERCYDAGLFSIFYKEFLRQFSTQYGLEQVADSRTSDVTRACFISVDDEAYFNTLADPVYLTDFVDTSQPLDAFDKKAQQDKETHEAEQRQKAQEREERQPDPSKEVIDRIKQQLNPKVRPQAEKPPVFVPQQLTEIIDSLKAYIEETGLIVTEILSIQYGKKIRIKMGLKEAEINLFFGKRGFSVVKSPRCGTNDELNDVCAQLVQAFIDTQ